MRFFPEGPSFQHLRFLIPKTINSMYSVSFFSRKYWVLGPSGFAFGQRGISASEPCRKLRDACAVIFEHQRFVIRFNPVYSPSCSSEFCNTSQQPLHVQQDPAKTFRRQSTPQTRQSERLAPKMRATGTTQKSRKSKGKRLEARLMHQAFLQRPQT